MGAAFTGIVAFLKALPELVKLMNKISDSIERVSAEIQRVRLEKEVVEAFNKAKENYDTSDIERLLGRRLK